MRPGGLGRYPQLPQSRILWGHATGERGRVLRVLVVDDEPALLILLKHIVEGWGHECLTADSAAQAHKVLTEEEPDVMFLDVSMPEVDGVTFLKRIRQENLEPPHVALLSALPKDHLDQLSVELNVAYITKPFTGSSLRAEFQRLLGEPA
jgi:CheY-like chemotaxis protein